MFENLPSPPSLDTWTTLFLVVAAQGVFLTFILSLQRRGNRQANLLLAAFILCFSVTLIEYVLHWTRYLWYVPNINGLYMSLVFFFGPLLLLYCKTLIIQEKLVWKDALHFVVPLLYFINRLPYHFSDPHFLRGIITKNPELYRQITPPFVSLRYYNTYIMLGSLCLYAVLIFLFLRQAGVFQKETEKIPPIQQRWFKTLFGLFLGFVLAYLSYYILVGMPYFSLMMDYQISFAMTVFIYTVGYLGYKQPEIFSGKSMQKIFIPEKYRNSSLTDSAAASLKRQLLQFMAKQKPYLDNELRLASLAQQLQTTPHHLSQLINAHFGKSFSDFINEYRIQEAQALLKNPSERNTYIINIAYSVGFNNKTSFNKAFKTHTGLSPSEFKKQVIGVG